MLDSNICLLPLVSNAVYIYYTVISYIGEAFMSCVYTPLCLHSD